MEYPSDFPPESRARVAAERLRAGKDFDEAREHAPYRAYGSTVHLEAELRKYILRQFAVFVSEACELGCQGIWSVDRIEEAALEFLRRSTIEATFSKGSDKSGRTFGRDWIGNWGDIGSKAMREFERSEEWRQFQEGLLQVAECQVGRASGADTSVPEKTVESVADVSLAQEVAISTAELPVQRAAQRGDRRAAVEAFLVECNKLLDAGSKVVKRHLWQAAGHTDRRQFQYWQSGSEEATAEDDRNFRRILSMSPADFLALLQKKGIPISIPSFLAFSSRFPRISSAFLVFPHLAPRYARTVILEEPVAFGHRKGFL
jgi:hypothetical protein